MRSLKHTLWAITAAMLVLLAACIDNDIPFPIIVAEIVEFEVEGQVGEAQIDVDTRSVNFEVADTIDLQHMRITKFKMNKEAHPAAVGVGSIISCVDSIELMLETYQVYRWVLRSKQQFTPEVRIKGQLGDAIFDSDTIRVYVKNVAKASIEALRLAPGTPSYSPDLSTITDFTQPIEIDVTLYGNTRRYVLVLQSMGGAEGPSIVEFAVDGQVGDAQVNATQRTVSIEVDQNTDLRRLSLTKLTLSEADATASIAVGDELSGVDDLPITLTDADGEAYQWTLQVKQQFTPVVRLKGQQGDYIMNKDTITVYVKSISKTAIEELILAPEVASPSYSPALANITDFTQPIDIDVTVYGRTKRYVLSVLAMAGMGEGPTITQLVVDGQVGDAQINAAQRTVSIEVSESTDLLHLHLTQLTLSEANATASIAVGDELSGVEPLTITLTDADGDYQWTLLVKQQFTPVVRLKGQLGSHTISNGIIRVFVDDVATTYIEELILAPAVGNPSYNPDPFGITDFTQPVDIDVTAYGKTTRYTLNVGGLAGYPCDNPVISITTGNASPQITTATIEAEVAACSAVLPYFEYRKQGDTQWISTPQGYAEAGATAYTATLDGLEPNTTYEYRAVANGTEGDVRTFTTNPDPIQTITTVEAVTSGRTAELKANVVCLETVQVHFEYRAFGATDWLSTPATSASAVATIATTIDGLEYSTDYEFRAVATSSIGRREGAIMQFRTDDAPVNTVQSITTSGADPWAKFAHVSGSVTLTQPTPIAVEYRQQGGDWQQSAAKMGTIGPNNVTITITGLQPNTPYECRLVAADQASDQTVTFTTDDAPTVPNLGFEDWQSKDVKNVLVGSSTVKFYMPWASGQSEFWTTGNKGLTEDIPGITAYLRKPSNNTPTTDAHLGTAARLETIGGITQVKIAAGSIFIGTYETVMTAGREVESSIMGRPYQGRPTTLNVWYKYSPKVIDEYYGKYTNGEYVGQNDSAHIYIYLLDWSKKAANDQKLLGGKTPQPDEIIAYGELKEGRTLSDYVSFSIKLNYHNTTKRPTHIIICATSSHHGAKFTGGIGSTLWVDEFDLGFDYVEP